MATVRGQAEVKRFMAQLPAQLATRVVRGAARAAANVVMEEAKGRVESDEVRDALATKVTAQGTRVIAKVYVKPGWAHSVGTWLEWGTGPHIIRASDRARQGMSIGRINRLAKAPDSSHSLVIGGSFVGEVVHHPGARAHPFLRVSLDVKEAEALAAAQSYINSRVGPWGITGSDEPESEAA